MSQKCTLVGFKKILDVEYFNVNWKLGCHQMGKNQKLKLREKRDFEFEKQCVKDVIELEVY